jgi:hypothetical protein
MAMLNARVVDSALRITITVRMLTRTTGVFCARSVTMAEEAVGASQQIA